MTGYDELVGWYYPDEGSEDEDNGGDVEPIFTDLGYPNSGTALILRRPRTDVLRPMLREVGTIIRMTPWRDQVFEQFICDRQLDALDPAGMEYYPEEDPLLGGMNKCYAFRPDVVRDATVFRAKGLLGRMFATDRFLDLVDANGLTGLKVLPVWSSQTGPIGTLKDAAMPFSRFPPGFGTTLPEKKAAMRVILRTRGP